MLELSNKILWAIATSLLILSSIYFTKMLKFIQFKFKEMFKDLKNNNKKGITPFETLMLTLGGKIGVGSIAGIALGIYVGGIGSILWVWIITILSAILAYAETVLGVIYRERDINGLYVGGPSYYIKNGLGFKKLAILYSIIIIVSYIGGFLAIQANTITKSINTIITINPIIVGLIIILITAISILGGIKGIAKVSGKLVPFMSILYIFIVTIVIFINVDKVPNMILNIIKSGLNFKSLSGGLLTSIIVGIQRGIFSSEAGLGTAAIIASSSNTQVPSKQGYVQILGVYITGLFICTSTAFIILLSPYQSLILDDINGIEIINFAFNYHFGNIGNILLFVFIFLFSFSTIITGYYYGEVSLNFLFKKINKMGITIFKIITLIFLFLGSIMSAKILWNLVDSFVAILVIINVYALLSLDKIVIDETNCYKT